MREKLFIKLSMLLFVLGMSVNAAWAINISGMTPEDAETKAFWARLTAKPATTTNGSGKVFVVSAENYSGDPTDGDFVAESYDEGWSDIFLASSLINADVQFRTFAKANDGSYFTGWSFTDGYTDLGTENSNFWVEVTPSATKGHTNYRNYNLFAAFKAVQLVSYEMVSGSSQEVADDGAGNWKCTQTIKFRAETPGVWALSSVGDERHFKRPVVTKKTGTAGTWAIDDAAWISSGAGQNVFCSGDYAELTVPVTFTAPNSDAGEYAATLTLETYAGVKMTVYLYARRTVAGAEAIRYNKSKVQQETGDLATLLSNAAADDIIKLNGNYSDAVTINKNITFDLNGYTLSNTLTVSGGNVTLAYSPFGGSVNSMIVSGGKAVLNGGTIGGLLTISSGATVEQNGATISGSVNNNGSLTTTDGKIQGTLTSSKTLVVNGGSFVNESGVAIVVTGGTAQIKKGTISGAQYGVQTTGGATTIEKLAVVRGGTKALYGNGGSLTVNNGKFTDPSSLAEGDIVFNAGYFQTNNAGGSTALGKQVWRNTAGAEFRDGYNFFAGDQAAAQASNVSVCRIGHTSYNSLEEALAYANNSGEDVIIIMENDYTLKAGYYTIPSNATLIVPMSNDQETANRVVPRETSGTPAPVAFRKLIFESGVNMEVAGTIELTCTQYGSGETMGIPGGNYGHLIMKPGSHMTINNGGYLRAWGFVTGDGTKDGAGNYLSGEIDVRRGGTVHEMFQMGDWKGGDLSFTIAMEIPGMNPCWRDMAHLFPIYTYFIQNVESPVKYHPGASLICATSVNVAGSINAYANDIKVVGKEGEAAMFLMDEMADAENTWVRKYYDAKKDQQVYEVNSGAKLGSMVINLGEVPGAMFGATGTLELVLDSRKFVLPLTNNFKIHLLSGYMEFTQSTSCLPGMEVEVDKEAQVAITKNSDATIVSGALYFYDADQWSFQNSQAKGYVGNNGNFGAIVRYSPTWDLGTNGAKTQPDVRNINSPAAIGDAILNVHGTFRMGTNCAVYTTWSKNMETFQIDESGTGGASVISSNEDAGTFIFDAAAPTFDGLHVMGDQIVGFGPNVIVNYDHNDYGLGSQYPVQIPTVLNQSTPTPVFGFELCTSAKLKNGDGTFATTDGTVAGKSYCYMNGRWTLMEVAEENECFMKDNYGTYYAKPSEYVAVVATWDGENMVGNADHTFSDKDGAGRLFILMENCQWWEVEKKDNLYHCIHPNNDTYYYWDETEGKWMEQRFTITWLNYDGTEIKSYTYDPVTGDPEEVAYSVTYGTQAEYLGSNPTRPADIDYTYSFTGWAPALGKVTSDVTYTATYEKQQRKYTIIFTEEGGTEIERQFLIHNAMPSCENVPTKTGFTLQWEPEVAAVTGDATYRATWLEEPPTEYQVTFFDYNGTTELQKGNVPVGTIPTPPANPSGKAPTNEFTYEFDHWSPALEAVSVEGPKSYTAVYREVAKTYTVRFYQENGTAQIGEAQSLAYGEMPVAPTPTKQSPQTGYTYTYVWQNMADASKALETVKADADYKAVFTGTPNKYTVTLRSNPSEACTFAGAGLYDYGSSITISQTPKPNYTFTKWTDEDGNEVTTLPTTVNGDITLIANFTFEGTGYTITWNNWDGTQLASGSQKENTATTYVGATPTRVATEAVTYAFYGWSEVVNPDPSGEPADIIYKNGLTPKATADATYYAYFNESARTYDIAWKNEAGTVDIELDCDQPYGAAIAFNSATPTKTATAEYTYTFDGWSTTVGGDVEALPATVSGNAIFYAHFISTPIVSGYNLEIGVNDKETLAAATTKDNLIITSNGVSSGQLLGADNLSLNGEAIFRLEKTFAAGEWYAVAVPWTVSPSTGIYAGSSRLSLGSQIYVIEFDANAYAGGSTNTFDYWTFLHQTGHNMEPGKLYMIYLTAAQSKLDFYKKANANVLTTQTAVSVTGGEGVRDNWNAIANPALYHATLSTGATNVQKYNGNDSYILGSTSNMIVGEPMFVQVTTPGTVVATPVGGASPAPYRRAPKTEDDTKFVVELTQNGQLADRLIVETEEEKANEYVIGQDLAKFGVSSKVAQMWINRYDAKLCVNTVVLYNGVAEYPLSIFAPTAGEYTIHHTPYTSDSDYTLYLTYNGEAIWNLSDGAYVLNLSKGTDNHYGLRISAKAPQVTTGVDEAVVDAQGETRKVLIGNQVFIIRGDKVYGIDGRLVK